MRPHPVGHTHQPTPWKYKRPPPPPPPGIEGRDNPSVQRIDSSFLVIAGSAVCYKCDSKSDAGCTPESLSGVATTTCSRDHEFCAVYKKEPPGNSSLHQYTRYCASECRSFNTTYTIGRYQKTKHCVLCCDGDLCNNYLIDPCNPKSKVGRVEYGALIIVLITVIALYT